MPADIQVNSVQSLCGPKMASENTVFLPRQLAIIPASATNPRMISRIQIKKSFAGKMLRKRWVLVLVSEHYLAVLLKKVLFSPSSSSSAEQQ